MCPLSLLEEEDLDGKQTKGKRSTHLQYGAGDYIYIRGAEVKRNITNTNILTIAVVHLGRRNIIERFKFKKNSQPECAGRVRK